MIRIEGVQANGHSPNPVIRYQVKNGQITEIKYGQSLIEWQAVTGATRYKIIYKLVHAPHDDPPDEHSLPAPATSTNLRGIIIEELYELRVEAYRGNTLIGRSSAIFTLATDDAFEIRKTKPYRKVAGIEIFGYLDSVNEPIGRFDYVLCDTTLLADNTDTEGINEFDEAKKQVEAGIRVWGEVSSGMVSYEQSLESELDEDDTNVCFEYLLSRLTADPEDDHDVAGFVYAHLRKDMRIFCKKSNSTGCAYILRVRNKEYQISDAYILISKDLKVGLSCSNFLKLVTHEGGHVYGLGHSDLRNETVMKGVIFCKPSKRDIVAIKTIYQSR